MSREDWLEDSLTTEAEDPVLGKRVIVEKKTLAQGDTALDVGVMESVMLGCCILISRVEGGKMHLSGKGRD